MDFPHYYTPALSLVVLHFFIHPFVVFDVVVVISAYWVWPNFSANPIGLYCVVSEKIKTKKKFNANWRSNNRRNANGSTHLNDPWFGLFYIAEHKKKTEEDCEITAVRP